MRELTSDDTFKLLDGSIVYHINGIAGFGPDDAKSLHGEVVRLDGREVTVIDTAYNGFTKLPGYGFSVRVTDPK